MIKVDKFVRGLVVFHKVMGKGVVLGKTDDGLVEIRMENGQKEKYYPEELETEQELDSRLVNDFSDDKDWRIGR